MTCNSSQWKVKTNNRKIVWSNLNKEFNAMNLSFKFLKKLTNVAKIVVQTKACSSPENTSVKNISQGEPDSYKLKMTTMYNDKLVTFGMMK